METLHPVHRTCKDHWRLAVSIRLTNAVRGEYNPSFSALCSLAFVNFSLETSSALNRNYLFILHNICHFSRQNMCFQLIVISLKMTSGIHLFSSLIIWWWFKNSIGVCSYIWCIIMPYSKGMPIVNHHWFSVEISEWPMFLPMLEFCLVPDVTHMHTLSVSWLLAELIFHIARTVWTVKLKG